MSRLLDSWGVGGVAFLQRLLASIGDSEEPVTQSGLYLFSSSTGLLIPKLTVISHKTRPGLRIGVGSPDVQIVYDIGLIIASCLLLMLLFT